MMRVLVMCLYFGTSHGDNVREQCRRMLLNSQFRSSCAIYTNTYYVFKLLCMVSTAEDEAFIKKAQVRYIYQEPGITMPKICAWIRDKKNFAECISAPSSADNSVSWTATPWTNTNNIWRRQFRLSTGELCPYEETLIITHELKVTAHNSGEVYIDGKPIDRNLKWPTVSTYRVRADAQGMAFVTWNHETFGATGLLAYLSNGIKTDDKSGWVCSEEYEENWEHIHFDDSHWSPVNIAHTDDGHIIGKGSVTIGCPGPGESAEYFRKKLT